MSQVTCVRGRAGILTGASLLLLSGTAFAQEAAPAEAPAADPPPTEMAQAPEATAAPEAEPMAQEPAPAEEAPMEPAATEEAPAEAPMAPADEAPAEEADDALSFGMFADAYWGFQTAEAGTPVPYHRAYAWQSPAFANENGFSLSFLGVDASYDIGEAAATGSLRFGPSVPIYYVADTGPLGIDAITQAYVTWRPVENLELDLGQFGTIFGAEVAESWQNMNYSRGGLYYAMQPFWHTGLRAGYAFSDAFSLKAMVVNGSNNISEDKAVGASDDQSPTLALQAGITPSDMISIAAGGMIAIDAENNASGFDRFFDLVVGINPTDELAFLINFDFNQDADQDTDGDGQNDDSTSFLGASLAASYAFTDMFGVALRGEYLSDNDNALYGAILDDGTGTPADSVNILTGTLTLDLKPIPGHDNLVIRWDNRIESASENIYYDGDPGPFTPDMTDPTILNAPGPNSTTWFGTTVGLVVHTD